MTPPVTSTSAYPTWTLVVIFFVAQLVSIALTIHYLKRQFRSINSSSAAGSYSARFRGRRTNPNPPIVVVIDGPIAAGKSTLMRVLKDATTGLASHLMKGHDGTVSVAFIEEPVDIWVKVGILQRFYAAVREWAYRFQTFVFVTRIEAMQRAVEAHPDADIYVQERSIFTDRFMFVQLLIEQGNMDEMEREMYLEWWRCWRHAVPFGPSGFVYLDVPNTECMARHERRKRDGEAVPEAYNEQLRLKHEAFFTKIGPLVPVLRLKASNTGNYADNTRSAVAVCDQIAAFISDRLGDTTKLAATEQALLALGP